MVMSGSETPIVLVHGFAQSARTWDPALPFLRKSTPSCSEDASGALPVTAIDLVGHGAAPRPEDPAAYGIDAQADALLAAMRAAGGGEPAFVVGYSMGGRVALVAAQRDPAAFAGIVLESAGLGPADEAERDAFAQRNAAWAQRIREEGVDAFMAWWAALPLFATQRELPAETRAMLAAERAENDAEALARTFEHAGAHTMPLAAEGTAVLRGLAADGRPVGYIAGAEDAKYRAVADRVRHELAGLPSAHVSIVEGAGHNVHLERPEAFAHALCDLLAVDLDTDSPVMAR